MDLYKDIHCPLDYRTSHFRRLLFFILQISTSTLYDPDSIELIFFVIVFVYVLQIKRNDEQVS